MTSPTSASLHTVAAMVVFEGGAPKKSDYRKFKIRGDGDSGRGNGRGPDDGRPTPIRRSRREEPRP